VFFRSLLTRISHQQLIVTRGREWSLPRSLVCACEYLREER
jgi:hypothetical protein